MRSAVLFAGILLSCIASQASAQIKFDADGRGYTTRIGSTVFGERNGYSYNYTRLGNTQFYSDSTGTSGTRLYMNAGRYDWYSNPRTGYSNSGFYPYQNQLPARQYNTYAIPRSQYQLSPWQSYRGW